LDPSKFSNAEKTLLKKVFKKMKSVKKLSILEKGVWTTLCSRDSGDVEINLMKADFTFVSYKTMQQEKTKIPSNCTNSVRIKEDFSDSNVKNVKKDKLHDADKVKVMTKSKMLDGVLVHDNTVSKTTSLRTSLNKKFEEIDKFMKEGTITRIEHEDFQEECLKHFGVQVVMSSGIQHALQALSEIKKTREISENSYRCIRRACMDKDAELSFVLASSHVPSSVTQENEEDEGEKKEEKT